MNGAKKRIEYVCLSDLHLGEEHGLLTGVDSQGNIDALNGNVSSLESLVACFHRLWGEQEDKPTLILLGDVLELALTTDNTAYMAFERFVHEALVKRQLFRRIVYIPGNHDHHMWEVTRDLQYVENYLEKKLKGANPLTVPLGPGWHRSSMFILEEDERQTDLCLVKNLVNRFSALRDRGDGGIPVLAAYPHFGLRTRNGARAIVFHHGHYLEDLYLLMSKLRQTVFGGGTDATLEDIEATNFAWVDFFWSTMGRSGSLGPKINLLYTLITERPEQLRDYSARVAEGTAALLKPFDAPGPDFLMEPLTKPLLKRMVLPKLFAYVHNSATRFSGEAYSNVLRDHLRDHLTGPVQAAILHECVDDCPEGYTPQFPEELAFVFGHTHKPFVAKEKVTFEGNQGVPTRDLTVDVYNLGGWVVDKVEETAARGAAALLLDEDLLPTYLHLYQEEGLVQPTVNNSPIGALPTNELSRAIDSSIASDGAPWRKLAETLAGARAERARDLRRQLDAAHDAATRQASR